jgi:folate-binding Fe-S cluster repair protein YgfZ
MQSKANKDLFPDNWVTKLTNRSILSIRGRDATDLLQNTSTQDMNLFKESQDRAAVYTSFLTVKGKTLYDAIVVKPRLASQTDDDMEYWLDIHEEDIDPLRKHLRKYALRKNI